MATILESVISSEEFSRLPSTGKRLELIRGKVIEMNLPKQRHGQVVFNIAFLLMQWVRAHQLGKISGADSGFITTRNPDSVRGPDICFFSNARMPLDKLPAAYAEVAPEWVCEVLSPSDRWGDTLDKVAEYLQAGVLVVSLVDPETETVTLMRESAMPLVLHAQDEFSLSDIFGDFRVAVKEFFA